jgi:hypothetical protein
MMRRFAIQIGIRNSAWLRCEHFAFEFNSGALDPALLISPSRFKEELGRPNVLNEEDGGEMRLSISR